MFTDRIEENECDILCFLRKSFCSSKSRKKGVFLSANVTLGGNNLLKLPYMTPYKPSAIYAPYDVIKAPNDAQYVDPSTNHVQSPETLKCSIYALPLYQNTQ